MAGGAVAATKVLGGDDEYSGPLNFQMTDTYGNCNAVYSITSTLKMNLTIDGTNVSGKANWGGTQNFVSTTCLNLGGGTAPINNYGWGQYDPTVGGSTSNITFHHVANNRTDPENFRGDFGGIWDFTGALNGSTITGTMDYSHIVMGVVTGRVQIPVNITK